MKISSIEVIDDYHAWGTNPCSEIILRDRCFCNLSEVVVRADDTLESLKTKIKYATILGTLQSTLTDFRYLTKAWKTNTEEERLLGVSLTGIMDHPVLSGSKYDNGFSDPSHGGKMTLPQVLEELKEVAIETNKEWAKKLGIPQSAAITCVKPSGTVSQLVDSASGIHPRYSPWYIRTVRADRKDPLAMFMKEHGFPVEPDMSKLPKSVFQIKDMEKSLLPEYETPEGLELLLGMSSTWIFSFPVEAPEDAVFRDDRSALEQLDLWLAYQRHWCEHKPSITVYVKEHEWLKVADWVWEHFDEVSGISFLPHSDHSYSQAPYQEITEEEYKDLKSKMPDDVDWTAMALYESQDNTAGSQTLACTGGVCEIVDLTEEQDE